MSYQERLNALFVNPADADKFMEFVVQSLEGITFNGDMKIDSVQNYGVATLRFNEPKGRFAKLGMHSYVLSLNKSATVTLD